MTNDCKKMKRALIVTALARFTKSFLTNDIITLQKMGYEVHCAANIHHAGAECMPVYFEDMNVVFQNTPAYIRPQHDGYLRRSVLHIPFSEA